jgi:hypothetical protein
VTRLPPIADDLLALAHVVKRGPSIQHCPHEPHEQQRKFLALACDEALYGGAAGGGKSDALLMAALQYVHVPGYSAILFRRTFADLSLPGALMDRAVTWWEGRPGVAKKDGGKRWEFDCPGGGTATIVFAYLENDQDRMRYKGAEFQFVGFDETTSFSQTQYLYLSGRLRRPEAGPLAAVPLRMRGATNPGDVGHRWVGERWGIQKDGTQASVWVVRDGKELHRVTAAERPFVPARLADNAANLDVVGYRKSLSKLDGTTRDQLERGLWILDEEGRVYKFDPGRNVVDALPEREGWHTIFGIDLGSSERSPTTAFVRLKWHEYDPRTYVVHSRKEAGHTPTSIGMVCAEEQRMDPDVEIVMDIGGLGGGYANEVRSRHEIPVIPAEKRDKLGFRKLLNGALKPADDAPAELVFLSGECDSLEAELDSLVWNATGTDVAPGLDDHESDALLYAWRRSQAHRSQQAPGRRPVIGTPEWFQAEEDERLRAETEDARERAQSKDRAGFWTQW